MNLRRIAIIASVAAALTGGCAFAVSAQEINDGYSFLNIPMSSHAFALGGTSIANVDADVTLADQNPALMGPELDDQVALSYSYYMGSANFAGVRFGRGEGEHSAWTVGLRYLNYGKFEGYDEFGTPTGAFTPSDLIIEGSYTRDITERWRGGANLKLVYSGYEKYSAFALAADLGVNYYDEEHDLSFSAVLKNMGGQVKRFDKHYARVPFDIQLGYMQSVGSSPFQISITANHLTRWRVPYYTYKHDGDELIHRDKGFFSNFFRHLVFGLQYQPSDKFYICAAYNYKTYSDMASFNSSIFAGFSVGLGFNTRGFSMGAAFAMPNSAATCLMVNFACSIGELMR